MMTNTSNALWNRRQFTCVALAAVAGNVLPALADENRKRIGIVDDNLDNFHARVYLKNLREQLKDRGFHVAGAFALQVENSRKWALDNDVPWFESVQLLNDVVDYFAVLAPSTPQVHWELCRQVFPYGKPTFVDKTFAPDAATAERIFELADRYHVPVQTSSALRYTAVQKYVAKVGRENVRHMVAWGRGSNFDEYVIHPVELVISCMGQEVESILRRGDEDSQLLVNFSHGRTAVVNVYTKSRTPYAAAVTTTNSTEYIPVDSSQLFIDAAAAMLDFFETRQAQVDRRETMAIMRIIDAARDPLAREKFVKV